MCFGSYVSAPSSLVASRLGKEGVDLGEISPPSCIERLKSTQFTGPRDPPYMAYIVKRQDAVDEGKMKAE